jgi:hypothetical protein
MIPVALILATAIVLVRNKLILPRQNGRAERINLQREAHNDAVWAEEQQVDAQLNQASRDFATSIGTRFPQAYLYDEAVVFCLQMVQNHRAASVSDALNLYDTELKHRQIQDMHAAQLAETQRMRKQAAVGNVINAAMQGAVIGTLRHEGAHTRAALKKPVTVNVRVR